MLSQGSGESTEPPPELAEAGLERNWAWRLHTEGLYEMVCVRYGLPSDSQVLAAF